MNDVWSGSSSFIIYWFLTVQRAVALSIHRVPSPFCNSAKQEGVGHGKYMSVNYDLKWLDEVGVGRVDSRVTNSLCTWRWWADFPLISRARDVWWMTHVKIARRKADTQGTFHDETQLPGEQLVSANPDSAGWYLALYICLSEWICSLQGNSHTESLLTSVAPWKPRLTEMVYLCANCESRVGWSSKPFKIISGRTCANSATNKVLFHVLEVSV